MDSSKELLKALTALYPRTDFNAFQANSFLSDFGIDSIGVVQILVHLEKQIGVSISIEQFYELEFASGADLITLTEAFIIARSGCRD